MANLFKYYGEARSYVQIKNMDLLKAFHINKQIVFPGQSIMMERGAAYTYMGMTTNPSLVIVDKYADQYIRGE